MREIVNVSAKPKTTLQKVLEHFDHLITDSHREASLAESKRQGSVEAIFARAKAEAYQIAKIIVQENFG